MPGEEDHLPDVGGGAQDVEVVTVEPDGEMPALLTTRYSPQYDFQSAALMEISH